MSKWIEPDDYYEPMKKIKEKLTGIDLLQQEMDAIFEFLKDKNQKYGSSIIEPLSIFHKGTTIEAIDARIDDKLARIKNQSNDEDAELDLIGYLLWKRVLIKNQI